MSVQSYEAVEMPQRRVGNLMVVRGEDWRTRRVKLFIYLDDERGHAAHMEAGESGNPVLSYSHEAPKSIRVEVQNNLDQLKALFILWR